VLLCPEAVSPDASWTRRGQPLNAEAPILQSPFVLSGVPTGSRSPVSGAFLYGGVEGALLIALEKRVVSRYSGEVFRTEETFPGSERLQSLAWCCVGNGRPTR
jgi:hypothetical protein